MRDLDEAALLVQPRCTVVPRLHGQHDSHAPMVARPAEHVLDELDRDAGPSQLCLRLASRSRDIPATWPGEAHVTSGGQN